MSELSSASVPPFPVLDLEIREGDGGAEVWLNGSRLTVRDESGAVVEGPLEVSDERLYDTGRRAAAEFAQGREGAIKAVRVLALRADGTRDRLVVNAAGEVTVLDAARRSGTSASGRRSSPRLERRQRVVLVACGLAGCLVLGVMGRLAWSGDDDRRPASAVTTTSVSAPPRATPTQLPVLGPAGDVVTARWSSVGTKSSSGPVVVTGRGDVVTVSDRGEAVGVDPRTSAVRWSITLGRGAQSVDLSLVRRGSRELVAVVTTRSVREVDPGTGTEEYRRDLTDGEEAVPTPQGVIVRQGPVSAEVRDGAGRWQRRVVPPGADPVVPMGSDVVSVNARGEWWRVTSAQVSPPLKRLPAPEKGASPRGVLASTAKGMVFGWVSKDGKKQMLQLYRWGAFERPAQTVTAGKAGTTAFGEKAAVVSADGSWLIVDQSLVDLEAGKVRPLPADWQTATVLSDRAYARPADDQLRVVSRSGVVATSEAPGVGADEVGIPVAQVGTLGVVVAASDGTGSERKLYGVELGPVPSTAPAPAKKPTPAPSSTRSSAPTPTPTKSSSASASKSFTTSGTSKPPAKKQSSTKSARQR